MKPTELKRWPEICVSLQKQGYVGYQDADVRIALDPQTGNLSGVFLIVADPWGHTLSSEITTYIDPSEIKPQQPAPLPAGYLPLDCQK